MLVNLAKDWFGPDASLHMVVNNPHDFPDEWEIPGSAEKVGEEKYIVESEDELTVKPEVEIELEKEEEISSIDEILAEDEAEEKVITSKKK